MFKQYKLYIILQIIGFYNYCNGQTLLKFDHNTFILNEKKLEDSYPYRYIYFYDITEAMHKKYTRSRLLDKQTESHTYFWSEEGLVFVGNDNPKHPLGRGIIYLIDIKYDNKIKVSKFKGILIIGGVSVSSETTSDELHDILQHNSQLKLYNNRYHEKRPERDPFIVGLDFGDGWHEAELHFNERSHKLEVIDLSF